MTTKYNSSLLISRDCHLILFFILAVLLSACSRTSYKQKAISVSRPTFPFPGYEKLTEEEQILADSIIGYALDHEALYLKDSMLLQKASMVLKPYQSIRPAYLNKEGKLEAIRLFRDWWNRSKTDQRLKY